MPTPAEGAVGAIDLPSEERKRLAIASLKYKHSLMPELPDICIEDNSTNASTSLPKFFVHGIETASNSSSKTPTSQSPPISSSSSTPQLEIETTAIQEETKVDEPLVSQPTETVAEATSQPPPQQQLHQQNIQPLNQPQIQAQLTSQQQIQNSNEGDFEVEEDLTDQSLRYISWGLVFAILAIGYRKMLITLAAVDLDSEEYDGEL